MKKVFILGSCVSRDAFALEESMDKYSISTYIARTSFASSFHDKPTKNIDLSSIPSSFQRRMVENDILKQTKDRIKEMKFDILLVDLIDERFRLFLSDDNELFTISAELKKFCSFRRPGVMLNPGDDEFFERWKLGWQSFLDLVKSQNLLDKVVVSKIFWATKSFNGQEYNEIENQQWIDENNQWLNRMYHYIAEQGQFFRLPTRTALC